MTKEVRLAKHYLRHLQSAVLFALVVLSLLARPAAPASAASPLPTTAAVAGPGELLSQEDAHWIALHGPVRLGVAAVAWPPFDMFTPAGEYQGITADYLALLSARLGLHFEIVRFPSFDEALDALSRGGIDAMGSIAQTPERESFALFTLPYFRSQPVIITRKDDATIHALPDLAGKTIAIEKGFASQEYLKDLKGVRFLDFVGTKEALEAVSLGRANAYVGSLVSSTYIMDREALSDLEVRGAAGLPTSELRFATTRKLPELARLLDHGLASITEGEQAKIRKRWIHVAGLAPDWGAILRVALPIGAALVSIILVVLVWNRRLQRQVARRREAEAALARQMSFQMALLENLPSMVAYKDAEARYVGCNRAFEEAFGTPRDRIVGKTALEIEAFPEARRRAVYADDIEVLRTGERRFGEEQRVFADGQVHDILVWRHPFNLPDGKPAGLLSIAVDVSESKALERQAHEAERRLREITNSVPGAVYQFRINPDGSRAYTFMSEGIKDLRGVDREAVLRDYEVLWNQVLDEDKPAFSRQLKRVVEEGVPLRHDVRARLPDGTVKWLQAAADSRKEADGTVILNGYWVDVTEHKRMETALQEAKEAADAANRAKSSFLATMSHEIRTPMNGVLGMLELLSLSHLEEGQRDMLEVVRESGKSLLRIIDDILDFSKIEAGRLEVRPEPASVARIVEAVSRAYSGAASGKDLLLSAWVDPSIGPALMVDSLRLRQILSNFVGNALKFTAQGSIEIKAELVERKESAEIVRFSVKDTGIGIAAEDQKKLFRPFVQAEGDTTRRFGGSGLGLTICRRLADLMDGTIEMVSKPGEGTLMRLILPLPIAAAEDLPETAKPPADALAALARRRPAPSVAEAESEGTLVLVADDHPTNRMLLVRQLNTLGYAAEAAENGVEALEKWKSGRYALLITDGHMPEMDGYDLARAIRRLERETGARPTPIVACTANALAGEAENCQKAGMDGFLTKPVELRALLGELERWLPLPGAAAPPPEHASAGPRPAAEARGGNGPPIELSALAELSGGDEQVERKILADFRTAADGDVAELAAAIERQDCDMIARMSHRMRGASLMVGARPLAEICGEMQAASQTHDRSAIVAQHERLLREMERLRSFLVRP